MKGVGLRVQTRWRPVGADVSLGLRGFGFRVGYVYSTPPCFFGILENLAVSSLISPLVFFAFWKI